MGFIVLVLIIVGFVAMHDAAKKQPSLQANKWMVLGAYGAQMAGGCGTVFTFVFSGTRFVGTTCAIATSAIALTGMALAVAGMFRGGLAHTTRSFYFCGLGAFLMNLLLILATIFALFAIEMAPSTAPKASAATEANLIVRADSPCEIWIDGQHAAKRYAVVRIPLEPGSHEIAFRAMNYRETVKVKMDPAGEWTLYVDSKNAKVEQL